MRALRSKEKKKGKGESKRRMEERRRGRRRRRGRIRRGRRRGGRRRREGGEEGEGEEEGGRRGRGRRRREGGRIPVAIHGPQVGAGYGQGQALEGHRVLSWSSLPRVRKKNSGKKDPCKKKTPVQKKLEKSQTTKLTNKIKLHAFKIFH
jgi:hypothetical protein